MVLVDSCVWIDLLRGKNTPQTRHLEKLESGDVSPIAISQIVYFEVLRGIRSDLERKKVRDYFQSFTHLDYRNQGFDALIALSLDCQRKGLNLPKLGDWLILKTILDHSLEFLTSDRDFFKIRDVIPFRLIQPSP